MKGLVKGCFIFLLAVFGCICNKSFGQYGVGELDKLEKPNIGIVGGFSGFRNNFIELGIGFQPWEVVGHSIYYPFAGFLILGEWDLVRKLYGNSINAWYLGGPFSCGLSINRYSDFVHETYGVKPMIGISWRRIGIMYGYNIFITPNSIPDLGHHSLTIKYYYPLWKKE